MVFCGALESVAAGGKMIEMLRNGIDRSEQDILSFGFIRACCAASNDFFYKDDVEYLFT